MHYKLYVEKRKVLMVAEGRGVEPQSWPILHLSSAVLYRQAIPSTTAGIVGEMLVLLNNGLSSLSRIWWQVLALLFTALVT